MNNLISVKIALVREIKSKGDDAVINKSREDAKVKYRLFQSFFNNLINRDERRCEQAA